MNSDWNEYQLWNRWLAGFSAGSCWATGLAMICVGVFGAPPGSRITVGVGIFMALAGLTFCVFALRAAAHTAKDGTRP